MFVVEMYSTITVESADDYFGVGMK